MGADGQGGQAGFASEAAGLFLRFVASALSIAGLLILVKDNESQVQKSGDQTFTTTLKYSNTSAFVYLVYSNGIVAVYCCLVALSSTLSIVCHNCEGKQSSWIKFVLDQVLVYVLLAAASASSEVVYLLHNGNTKTSWSELCSIFTKFCGMAKASIVLSFLSAIVLALVSVLSARRLFRKYMRCTVETKNLSAN